MTQPTNADLLNAINGVEKRLSKRINRIEVRLNERIDSVATHLNKRLDKQDVLLAQIVETLTTLQNSEHKRDLGLVRRVEHLEQGATA